MPLPFKPSSEKLARVLLAPLRGFARFGGTLVSDAEKQRFKKY
jgi:hypothetical protein